jgi:hypothetical protein
MIIGSDVNSKTAIGDHLALRDRLEQYEVDCVGSYIKIQLNGIVSTRHSPSINNIIKQYQKIDDTAFHTGLNIKKP